jgi:hypothetical protein
MSFQASRFWPGGFSRAARKRPALSNSARCVGVGRLALANLALVLAGLCFMYDTFLYPHFGLQSYLSKRLSHSRNLAADSQVLQVATLLNIQIRLSFGQSLFYV